VLKFVRPENLPLLRSIAFFAFALAFAIKIPSGRSTPGCLMRTPKRPRPARWCWRACCSSWARMVTCDSCCPCSRCSGAVRVGAGVVGDARHYLWRTGGVGPDRFQKAGGVFVRQPHGLCGDGHCGGSIDVESPVQLPQGHAHIAVSGAVLQMFNHGLSSAALFALVGVVYERTHTRDLNELNGVSVAVPVYAGILMFCAFAAWGCRV